MDLLSEGWLVLPDRPDTRQVVAQWPLQARSMVTHASGNPWLVGHFTQSEVVLVTVGFTRLAVIGSCGVTAARLKDLVKGVRAATDLDSVAQLLPGCFHLIASIDGVVRVQGSVTGLRRVFHTQIKGMPVVCDRADVLAIMSGSDVDEQALTVRVTCGPHVPPPLGERSMWRSVRALAPDQYLLIAPNGAVARVQWWKPPEPTVPLAAGAGAVGQALETAIAQRAPIEGRLSADLSGGMDSTSLCFLAARAGTPDLLTFRWAEADTANDDALFAADAANELKHAIHITLPQEEIPSIFAGARNICDIETPYPFTRTFARARHSAKVLAAYGSRVHLAGHGGDELFRGPVAYVHPLIRRRPLTAITHIRGYRALLRWPLAVTVAGLASCGDYGDWWREQAEQLNGGLLPRRIPPLGWGYPLRPAVWITPAATNETQSVLRSIGGEVEPLADDRGQHVAVTILRMMGPHYRQLSRLFATVGLRLEMPYFDDRVVETVLSVRQYERTTPWRYKPLLVEAMRGILPDRIATRITKGEFSEDIRVGLRRHLGDILNIFADSTLAARGLINPDLLRQELLKPQIDNAVVFALEDLLGCESWLRAIQISTSSRRSSAPAIAQ